MQHTWPIIPNIDTLISRYSQDEAKVLICALNMMHNSFRNIKKWRKNVDIFSGKLAISQSMSYTLHDYIDTAKVQGILPRQALLPVEYMDQRSGNPYSAGIIVLFPDPVNSSKFIICQVLNPADPVRNDVIETWGKKINKGTDGLKSYIKDIKKKANDAKMSKAKGLAVAVEITKAWSDGEKTYTSSIDGTEYLLRKKYRYNVRVPLTENPNRSLANPNETNWPTSIKVQMLVDHPDTDFPHLTAAGEEYDIDLTNEGLTRMIYLIPQSIDEELANNSILDIGNAGNGNNMRNKWIGRVPKTSIESIDFNKETIKNWKGGMFQTLTRSILYGNYRKYGRINEQSVLSVPMNDSYNIKTKSWEGGGKQRTITPLTCKQPCDKDSDFEHWCCSICGRQIPKSNLNRGYDVDHVFNLIFNTYFDINSYAIGFLNTCSDCNIWKSEKIWCPNENVWEGLKAKAYPGGGGGDWLWNNITPMEAWITGTVGGAGFLSVVQGMTAKAGSKKRCKNLSSETLQDYYLNRLLAVLKGTTKGKAIVEACLSDDPLAIFRVEQDMESHYVNMALISLNLTSEANRLYDAFTRAPATRSNYKGQYGKDLSIEQIKKIQKDRLENIRQQLVNDIRIYQETQKSHQGSADFLPYVENTTYVPVTVGTPEGKGTNNRVVAYSHGSQPTFGASPSSSQNSSQNSSPKKDGSSFNPMEPIQEEDWRIPETEVYNLSNYLWGNIDKLANEFLAKIYPDLKQYETIEYDQRNTQKHPPNCNVLNPKWFDIYFKKLHWAGYNGQKNSEIPEEIRNHKRSVKKWRELALKASNSFDREINTKRYLFLDAVQQCGREYNRRKKFTKPLTSAAPYGIPEPGNPRASLSQYRGRKLSKSFDKGFQKNTAPQTSGMSSSSSAAGVSPRKPKGKRKADALTGNPAALPGVGRRLLRNAMDLPPDKCELPNISNISPDAIRIHNLFSQLGMLIFALRRDYAEGIFDKQENMGISAEVVGNTDSGRALIDNKYIGRYIKKVEAHKTFRKVWHHLNSIRNEDGTTKVVNPYLTETYNSKTTTDKVDKHGIKYMPGVIHHWSNFIILSALNHYCPRGEWKFTLRSGISSADDTIQIRYEGGQGGDTAHWVVWEQGSGKIQEINVYDESVLVERSNSHRVAGDCGPSAVIKAIQLIQARNRPSVRRKKGADKFYMGGKRTRKKRRKKKKTRRKRKYNKKTKGRKRKRRKRTRRKR